MNANLLEILSEFRDITLSLCDSLEREEFDNLSELLDIRQNHIVRIGSLDYSTSHFQVIAEELNLSELENKFNSLMQNKYSSTKQMLNKISVNKSVNANYNKKLYVDSIFFSKKI
jgi:hypothetical protein